jgi:hypothetical protein
MANISNPTNCTKKNFIVAITPDSVILICMIINDDFTENENTDALQAMDSCMSVIGDLLLDPALDEDKLSETEAKVLGLVGETLKEIARRAYAYEQIQKGELSDDYRN